MKRPNLFNPIILILGVIIFSLQTNAQTTTAFRKNYNQALFDLPGNIVEGLTPETYVMAGTNLTFLPIYGTVTELNDTGAINWSYRYSDASIGFQLNDIKKDAGNNQYITCGGSETNDAVFMVLDATGNVVISRKFSINEADGAWFNRVIKASDGGYVAVGYVTGHDPDGAGPETYFGPINYTDNNGDPQTEYIGSPLIVKLDASGNHVWHRVFRYYTAPTTLPAQRIYNDASFVDVVEVSDGYVAVGSYDVNQHLSATNSDGDDATPTDAIILKTSVAGAITYHKQIDNPDTDPSQNSKYLAAVNTTSTGDLIMGGMDNTKELVQKYVGPGGFSNIFTRKFTYPGFLSVTDVSQIYEVNGGTDIATMSMYIQPTGFVFSNAIHRFNSTATSTVFAKRYDFNLISILPRGNKTSDNGYISMSMTAGGANYDYHVIKTDPNGDTPATGCPPVAFTPTPDPGPTTSDDPSFTSWVGTPGPNSLTIIRQAIAPTPSYVCTKVNCAPPTNPTASATTTTICSGSSTTINGSGSGVGATYNVYTAPTGGTNLGSTPLVVSPGTTTTYYVEAVVSGCSSTTRDPITITVVNVTTSNAGTNQSVCATSATLAGNTPTDGTGTWTLVSGAGTITTPSSPTSGVTGLGAGSNVFEWTITNAPCTPSTSQVTITVVAAPTTSNAGTNQSVCATTATLAGNTPTVGTGTWTLVSGSGTITTPSSPTSGVTGLGVGPNVFEWTISNAPCAASTSQVTITGVAAPTTSNAGANQSVCATTATLAGNTPTVGTGTWTLVSGSGTITTPSSPTSGVTGLGVGPNVFEWTISNAPCAPSTSQVTITGVAAPTTSNAGTNQTICATSTTLAGNTPTVGTGTWTLVSGSGTITTPSSPTSGVTGLGVGPNVFEWTISNAPCAPSTSQVTITNTGGPTTSNAGPNQSVCATTATLAGNTPAVGTGTWTLISGSGTITTPSSPTSGVTGLGVGPNVFEWTISNAPCTPSTSQVTITGVAAPTTSNAGTNQSVCATTATLAGNTPTVGTGTWTLVSGSGTITTPSSPTSGVTGLGVGPNVFEWTISNAPCAASTSQVTITGVAAPTTSNAGTNQSVCATTATLAGNTPTVGTGTWTLVSGAGTITTPSSPTSGITGLGVGPNVFEWTIDNPPCAASTSQVTITGVAAPTTSNAGTNQTICATATTLAGNTPTVGTGTWTLVSGSGTITTPSSPTSGVTGLGAGPNVFEWTIDNPPCAPSTSQVTITNTGGPTTSNAGPNQSVCATTATLAGNTPTVGTGTWTLISGSGTITTPSSPTSGVTGLGVGPNVFEWTISNAPCTPSTSQVTITGVAAPTASNAGANQTVCANTATLAGNTPAVGTGTWTLVSGSGTITTPSSPTSGVTGLGVGPNVFEWTIDNSPCASSSTQVTITYSLGPTVTANSTDTIICLGDTITLTGSGAVSYTWTNGVTDGISFSPSGTTTYIVTGTDANSCSNDDTITVTVNPLPNISSSGTNTICNGDSTTLTASGGISYVWNTSDTTVAINVNPSSTTTYNVTGTDINGCQNTSQITVTVLAPPTANVSGTNSSCFGDIVNLTASGGGTYLWNTGDTTTVISVNPTDTTTYTLIATIGSCVDTTTFTVNVIPLPTIILSPSPDTTIALGESAYLTASGGTSYTWDPSTDLSCSTCANPTATPDITTTYCVSVTNSGCVDTSCVTVIVDINCGEVFVPSAFSPNGDGANDCLKVYNNCIETMVFRVYARWGEMVFEATDVDQCWDGSYKGKDLNDAVFVYTLEATLITGEEVSMKGNVSLIR